MRCKTWDMSVQAYASHQYVEGQPSANLSNSWAFVGTVRSLLCRLSSDA